MTSQRATLRPERARELFDAGLSCGAIAREMGVSASTVSRWAKREGLSFLDPRMAKAQAAQALDFAVMRSQLAAEMHRVGMESIARASEPYTVYGFGGKDGEYHEAVLEKPPAGEVRNFTTAAGIAFDKITRIVEQSGDGAESTRSMLRELGRALGVSGDA